MLSSTTAAGRTHWDVDFRHLGTMSSLMYAGCVMTANCHWHAPHLINLPHKNLFP